MFRHDARLIARGRSSAIDLHDPLKFRYDRRTGAKKAQKAGCVVRLASDLAPFWKILSENLMAVHGVLPVHSLEEMELLRDRFPHNIRCYETVLNGEVIAGALVYETHTTAHTQYLSASWFGKKYGALDLLLDRLIHEEYASKNWFDFGISTEEGGRMLNQGLVTQKEGFGARAVLYDIYKLALE